MAFKLKGFPKHAGVGIKRDDCGTNLPDGRSPSSALQQKEQTKKVEISEKEYDEKVAEMRRRNMSEAEITDIMKGYKVVKSVDTVQTTNEVVKERTDATAATDPDRTPMAKKGLWHNIHAKRARGERPAKPGEKGYPKTLDID